jgi:hypothetical protein
MATRAMSVEARMGMLPSHSTRLSVTSGGNGRPGNGTGGWCGEGRKTGQQAA